MMKKQKEGRGFFSVQIHLENKRERNTEIMNTPTLETKGLILRSIFYFGTGSHKRPLYDDADRRRDCVG